MTIKSCHHPFADEGALPPVFGLGLITGLPGFATAGDVGTAAEGAGADSCGGDCTTSFNKYLRRMGLMRLSF